MVIVSGQVDTSIDKKNVYRYLGYSADSEPPARISALIEEYAEEIHHLITPSYSYVFRQIERVQGSRVYVEGSGDLLSQPIVFESEVIARLLEQSHRIAVLLMTIGNLLEETVCQLAEDGLVLQASVLDAIGSDAVEKVADYVEGVIGESAYADGFVISRRFSPGYCDWDITQQRAIFRAVNGSKVGVDLTDRCLMIPRKSISGIVGIGLPESDIENYNPCKTCDKYDCRGRR